MKRKNRKDTKFFSFTYKRDVNDFKKLTYKIGFTLGVAEKKKKIGLTVEKFKKAEKQ